MTKEFVADVIVVGAGPVGLSLALDLAARGATVVIAEKRAAGVAPSVKCNHVASRTMESFRALGIADLVRSTGLPDDFPNDVVFRTRATGPEIARILIPSRAERFTRTDGPDGDWATPEPPHRINQIFLEPLLFRLAEATPGITIVNDVQVAQVEQDDDGTVARATSLIDGEPLLFSGRYLVGCDGGGSLVRKQIGARFFGDAVIDRVESSYVRAPALLGLMPSPPAWMTYCYNNDRVGAIFAIDGKETWLIHYSLRPDEPDFDILDRDAEIRKVLGVGPEFEYELLNKEDWIGRRLVADHFRSGRIFICGDAAHLWIPMAGYGMNAGIADALNLSWMLAATLKGWAPESLLDAHEAERLPITDQVSRFAMAHAIKIAREQQALPETIEDDTAQGDAARQAVGRAAYDLNVEQFCCAGLNYGYFYDKSPIISFDHAEHPAYSMGHYEPSTVPGCRLPHFWLPDGRSLYDAMDAYYVLLRFDPSIDVARLLDAAGSCGMPLQVLDIAGPLPASYSHALLLARPDRHVAWRGDQLPDNVVDLVDLVRGAGLKIPTQAPAETTGEANLVSL